MGSSHPVHREVHFWNEELVEPPCGTLEDRFDWSDVIEDVTCEECRRALAGDDNDLAARAAPMDAGEIAWRPD